MNINKKVIIVDDQKDLREQLAKLLKNANKRNETSSLVQQMRSRLLGKQAEEAEAEENAEEGGYLVDTAGQGEEGYELIKKAVEQKVPYAIVFLDMRMPPGWDGLETAKKIREVDKDIEIVIMTAYADHDQKTIAESVGVPEKLLYIKKPFHTEEIFQLALSLTSKWSLERRISDKRRWLELLVRSMSKIQYSSGFEEKDFQQAVLKALTDFVETDKGFIVAKGNGDDKKWKTLCAAKFEQKEIDEFVGTNNQRLESLLTTHNFDGKFLLPLKKDKYFAVGVMGEAVGQNDPEWYKFLSLLLMTASSALRNAAVALETSLANASTADKLKMMLEKTKELQKDLPNSSVLTELIAAGAEVVNLLNEKKTQ